MPRRLFSDAVGWTALLFVSMFSCVESPDEQSNQRETDATKMPEVGDMSEQGEPIVGQYRQSSYHTGRAPEGSRLEGRLALKWRTERFGIGDYFASKSSPAVDVDRLFVGVDDGRLLALSRESGAVLWAFETHRFDEELRVEGRRHLGIHSSPAFDDTAVYIGDYSGYLYAVDKESGVARWERKLGGSIGASPTLHEGRIYMAVEFPDNTGKVFVLAADTGRIVWQSAPLSGHPHATVSIDDGREMAIIGANDGVLYAFDISDGTLKWRYQTGGPIKSTAAIGEDTVYVTSWDARLHAVSLDTGAPRFMYETLDATMSSPALFDNRVYFGSHDTRAYALDAHSGELAWMVDTNGAILSSPTVVEESGIIVVGSLDRQLLVVYAATGDLVSTFTLPAGVTSVPVVVGDTVFVNDDSGIISCYL